MGVHSTRTPGDVFHIEQNIARLQAKYAAMGLIDQTESEAEREQILHARLEQAKTEGRADRRLIGYYRGLPKRINAIKRPRRPKQDLTLKKFGKVLVLRKAEGEERKDRETWWFCRCSCGKLFSVRQMSLLLGRTKSCGCQSRISSLRHGLFGTSIYRTWWKLKAKHRKGKIQLCDSWLDVQQFARDVGKRPSRLHYVARLDESKPYGPDNFAWRSIRELAKGLSARRCNFRASQ